MIHTLFLIEVACEMAVVAYMIWTWPIFCEAAHQVADELGHDRNTFRAVVATCVILLAPLTIMYAIWDTARCIVAGKEQP